MHQDKFPTKRFLGIITFVLLLYWALLHPSQVGAILSGLFALVSPFVLGFAIAFIVNVPLRLLEGQWDKHMKSSKGKRPVCLVASLIIIVAIIFALFFIVVPALGESFANLASQLPQYVRQLESLYLSLTDLLAQHNIVLPTLDLDLEAIYSAVLNFFTNYGQALVDTTVGVTTSIVSVVVNFVLALVFSLYVLAQKETLMRQGRKVVSALLPQRWANKTLEVATLTNKTFANFVTGQLTEAVILGSLCFLGMTLLRIPYAAVVSVLIGFCALIPSSAPSSVPLWVPSSSCWWPPGRPCGSSSSSSSSSSWRVTSSTPVWWASPWACRGSGSWLPLPWAATPSAWWVCFSASPCARSSTPSSGSSSTTGWNRKDSIQNKMTPAQSQWDRRGLCLSVIQVHIQTKDFVDAMGSQAEPHPEGLVLILHGKRTVGLPETFKQVLLLRG